MENIARNNAANNKEVWVEIRCHLRMHCLTDWNHLYQLLVYGMLDFVPKPAAPT